MSRTALALVGVGFAIGAAHAEPAARSALTVEVGQRTLGDMSYDYAGAEAGTFGVGLEIPRGSLVWSATLRRASFRDAPRVDLALGVGARFDVGRDRVRGRLRIGGGVDRAEPGDSDIRARRWFAEIGLGATVDLSDDLRLFGELVEARTWLDSVDGQDVYLRYVPIPGDERHHELRLGLAFGL